MPRIRGRGSCCRCRLGLSSAALRYYAAILGASGGAGARPRRILLRQHHVTYPWWALIPTLAAVGSYRNGTDILGWPQHPRHRGRRRYRLDQLPSIRVALARALGAAHCRRTDPPAVSVGLVASFLLAWGTYAFLERPLRRGVRPNLRNALMLSAPIAAAALRLLIVAVDGLPGRWPKQLVGA